MTKAEFKVGLTTFVGLVLAYLVFGASESKRADDNAAHVAQLSAENADLNAKLALLQATPAPEPDYQDLADLLTGPTGQVQAALPAPPAPTGGDTSAPSPTPAPEPSTTADTPSTPPSDPTPATEPPVVTDEAQASGDTASA